MIVIYILLAIFGLWFGLWAVYKIGQIIYYGIRMGIAQANAIEREFGTDVISAAKYSVGLPFAPKAAPDPAEGEQHADA